MPEHQQIQQSTESKSTVKKQAISVSQTPASNTFSIIQRAKINPRSLTHADIMQLQRTIGNRAVGMLLTGIGNTSTVQQAPVQRQETPADEETCPSCMQRQEIPEEEEPLQGKMTETVQRQAIPEEEEPLQGKMVGTVQRQEIPEEDELLQGKMVDTIQHQEITEEEEPLQGKMKEPIQRQELPEEKEPLQSKFENKPEQETCPSCSTLPIRRKNKNLTCMPDNLKAGVENLSGIDMSDVKVHYNSDKPAKVGHTQGIDIHVAQGQERHLSHEAWHVVQQAQGRVRPTMQMKDGVPVNDDEKLEHEADVMGARALTSGKDIFFRPGKYELGSKGRELTNAMQQNGRTSQNLSVIQRNPQLQLDNTYLDPNYPHMTLTIDAQSTADRGENVYNAAGAIINPTQVTYEDARYYKLDGAAWYPKYNFGIQVYYRAPNLDTIVNIADIDHSGGNPQFAKKVEILRSIVGGYIPAIQVRDRGVDVIPRYMLVDGRNRIDVSLEQGYTQIPVLIV